jgi:hypothetical protein
MIPRKCCWCGRRFLAFVPYRAKSGFGKAVCSRKCQREISRDGGTFDGCLVLIGILTAAGGVIVGGGLLCISFWLQ